MLCSVFICALRSLYSALNVIPLHCLLLYESNVLIASWRVMMQFLILPLGFVCLQTRYECSNKNCAYRDSNWDLSLSSQALCQLVHSRPWLDSVLRSAASHTMLNEAAFTLSGTEYRRTVFLVHRNIILLRCKSFKNIA